MPKLNVEMFDEAPSVGDKVKVIGKILSIDEESGDVEVSYDEVTSNIKEKSKKSKNRYSNDDDLEEDIEEESNSQSLDNALGRAFNNTQ